MDTNLANVLQGLNLPNSGVSNGFPTDGPPLGSTLSGGALSHMSSIGNLSNSLLSGMGINLDEQLHVSGASTVANFPDLSSGPTTLSGSTSSQMADPSLPDLKLAGLETSLGFNYSSMQQQGSAGGTDNSGVANLMQHMQPIQSHSGSVNSSVGGHLDMASISPYMNPQKKSHLLLPETPKSGNAGVPGAGGGTPGSNKSKVVPKNLTSWSSLAQTTSSTSTPTPSLKNANDSFAQFKKAAKEKEAKVRIEVDHKSLLNPCSTFFQSL